MSNHLEGKCAIKAQYLIAAEPPTKRVRLDESEKDQQPATEENNAAEVAADTKPDETGDGAATEAKAKPKPAKKAGGMNKSRKATVFRLPRTAGLCKSYMNGPRPERACSYDKCKYMHDVAAYLAAKGADIGEKCHIYSTRGFCVRGVTCRFAAAHLDAELRNQTNEELWDESRWEKDTMNAISHELQTILRKRTYVFDAAKASVQLADKLKDEGKQSKTDDGAAPAAAADASNAHAEPAAKIAKTDAETTDAAIASDAPTASSSSARSGAIDDTDTIAARPAEAPKRLDLRNKLLLSPLTTVGNLPFRRICKEYGADVTCGEMACAVPLVNGITQEWALTKRHHTEDIFGVQLCANSPLLLSYAAQLVRDHCTVDFVDLNIGCPIELIYNQGAGSALIRRQNILEVMVRSCSDLLGSTPFTVKTRTGVYAHKSVAHELVPRFEQWGAAAVTVHGRSREQRYTKNANWEYIEECARAATSAMPVFGNGDVLSWDDFRRAKEVAPSIGGVMIGRGALIKPWLFREIKEQRDLDPSAAERFEMLRKFCNYGMEHWGSDTQGVENTRRFLLEWQSFLYRYVPFGVLERPPQRINERPDSYLGRDDLETLMASPNAQDWVRLSEMLLGPVPDGYVFVPKHRANAF